MDTEHAAPKEEAPPYSQESSALAKDWERTVYNLLYRVLGNRKTAKRLTQRLSELGVNADLPVTFQARDLARAELDHTVFAKTLFASGRQILSQPLDPEELPHLGPSVDMLAMERDVKDAVPRELLIVLELLFVDRRPMNEVAQLFGLDPEFLLVTLVRLVDTLGDITQYSHDSEGECPHPIRTIRARIDRHLSGSRTLEEPRRCATCREIVSVIDSILAMFAKDSRILSLVDGRWLRQALEGPRVKVTEPQRAFAQPSAKAQETAKKVDLTTPQTLPEPNPWAWRLTGVAAAILVLYATFSTISIGTSDGEHEGGSFKKGLKALKQDSLGTYSDLTSPSRELLAQSTLTAAPNSSLYLTYHSGVQIELYPNSVATVNPNRIKLEKGRIHLKISEGPQPGFFVSVGDLIARIKEGDLLAAMIDSTPIRFALKAGQLDVKDAKGRKYRLDPATVMKSSPNGLSYLVEESTAEDLTPLEARGTSAGQ